MGAEVLLTWGCGEEREEEGGRGGGEKGGGAGKGEGRRGGGQRVVNSTQCLWNRADRTDRRLRRPRSTLTVTVHTIPWCFGPIGGMPP